MSDVPEKIKEIIENLSMFEDRAERIQALISIGEQYRPAPFPQPYDEDHRVPGCESQVFIWADRQGEGWHFEFAVENPQGLSAMAMAVILQDGLEGLTSAEIAKLPDEIVYEIFGRELSMGKSMGLMNMVQLCRRLVL